MTATLPTPLLQPEPKRDKFGRYLLPDPGEPGATSTLAWTRATTFAKSLSDTYHLERWSCRMVAKGVATRPDLYALAASAPVDDKATLDRVADAAKEAAASSSGANLGNALHAFTERSDRGEQVVAPPPWDADLRAYRLTMQDEGVTAIPEFVERIVVVERFHVAGQFDRILRLSDGRLVIGDIKTQKDFYSWTEIAVQLALYANAEAIWDANTETYEPMPAVDREVAVVMHVPVGKATCELYWVDIATGWEDAKLCAKIREARARKNLARPFGKPARQKAAEVGARLSRTALLNAVKKAVTPDELVALWRAADAAGTWTDAATEAARQRKAHLAATQAPTST